MNASTAAHAQACELENLDMVPMKEIESTLCQLGRAVKVGRAMQVAAGSVATRRSQLDCCASLLLTSSSSSASSSAI